MSRVGKVFRVIELNHIIHRLCGSPSISLSFNLARPFRGGQLHAVSLLLNSKPSNNQLTSFRAWTTRAI